MVTPALAINGFECCDLWPFEPEIFLLESSVASKLTDEPKIQDETLSKRESMSSEHSCAQIERQCCEARNKCDIFHPDKEYLHLKYLKYLKKPSLPTKVSLKRPRTRRSMPATRLTSTLEKCALETKRK